jgi:hypothetical protein
MNRISSRAPDVFVTNTEGDSVRISTYWQDNPLVIVFLRHFG